MDMKFSRDPDWESPEQMQRRISLRDERARIEQIGPDDNRQHNLDELVEMLQDEQEKCLEMAREKKD